MAAAPSSLLFLGPWHVQARGHQNRHVLVVPVAGGPSHHHGEVLDNQVPQRLSLPVNTGAQANEFLDESIEVVRELREIPLGPEEGACLTPVELAQQSLGSGRAVLKVDYLVASEGRP